MQEAADASTFERLERVLLRPDVRCSREALVELLAPDFVEFGTSGRVYDREQIIAALTIEGPGQRGTVQISHLTVRPLSESVVLVTYQTVSRTCDHIEHCANRSSIWRRSEERWQMAFHQGTPVSGP
jgi:hypothetical protein